MRGVERGDGVFAGGGQAVEGRGRDEEEASGKEKYRDTQDSEN